MRGIRTKDWIEGQNIEVTNIRKLLLEKSPSSVEIPATTNRTYGVFYQLKKYAGIDTEIPLNCTYEHGAGLKKFVCQIEVMHHASHILTYSSYREEVITELTDLTPVAIGPYIAYAEDYRSREYVDKMKKKYGRILLVMPSHSTTGLYANYDVCQFIQQIEVVRKDFDTVMVCFFWTDLMMGADKPYRKKGYEIVSAGNTSKTCFLSRLKYILMLCDAVIANSKTTGLAYALYMNKPVRLFKQSVYIERTGDNNAYELEAESHEEQFYRIFGQDTFTTASEQQDYLNYLFGFNKVKTKEEMRKILLPLLRKCGGNNAI